VLERGEDTLSTISSGLPFFDHMLTAMAYRGGFGLEVQATGDLEVGGHHVVEDVGIVMVQALAKALGDRGGIERFGHAYVPMDDALVGVFVDVSGRPFLHYGLELPERAWGCFHTDLVEEFLRALATNSVLTIHLKQEAGHNAHHIVEATLKALRRALGLAVATRRVASDAVPSAKGIL